MANTKNRTVLTSTVVGLESGLLNPITKVSTMMPMMSSMIAALNMVVPTCPFNLPISFSDSTVMLTDVAVRIVPTKTAL